MYINKLFLKLKNKTKIKCVGKENKHIKEIILKSLTNEFWLKL